MTPMQPLGAPGTPASSQALPYNYFPAPRIGPASAGSPAAPIAPAIQNTQAQIGDALAAAQGTQQLPPPQQGRGWDEKSAPQGALGMAAGTAGHTQQPTPGGGMYSPQQMLQTLQMPQMPQIPPMPQIPSFGGMGGLDMLPPQIREMFGSQRPRFWGGFNWGGQQQPQNPGQSPQPNYSQGPAFDPGILQLYRQRGQF